MRQVMWQVKWRHAALALAACFAGAQAAAAPTLEQVKAGYRTSESVLLDRSGAPIQSIRVDMTVRRLPWVTLADISPVVGVAVIQAEDQHFQRHGGVDLGAIGQAAWDNLFNTRARGASTITMQLAGMLDPRLRGGAGGAAGARSGTRPRPRANLKRAGAKPRSWKPI